MVLALATPCAQLRAETPSDNPSETSASSTVQEVPLLELMTFRDVGQPMPTVYVGSQPAGNSSNSHSGEWSVSRVSEEHTLGGMTGSNDTQNQLYNSAFPPDPLGPRPRYMANGIPSWAEEELSSRWDIEVELGLIAGSSTYVNNDGHFFKLSETYTSKSNNEYLFYQEHNVDHSYYNSRELVLGARQDFDSFWLNGGLRLTEEFSDYTDIGNALNNRQTGLFKLRFDPQTEDGSWRGLFDYRYNVRTYETFSTRGFILHSSRFKLEYPVLCRVTGEARVRFDDYNYSAGSTRSHDRLSFGNTFTWEPSDSLRLSASADKDRKKYELSSTRDYDKHIYRGDIRWKPGDKTQIDFKGAVTDYDRELNPDRSYQDNLAEVRLQHELTCRLDVDARIVERQKDYDIDPLDDLDIHRRKLGLNYNADCNWNFGISWDESEYDYALLTRSHERNVYTVDGTYSAGDVRLTGAWRSTQNDYELDPMRDYVRNDYNLDADWRFGLSRLRVYFGVADFSQTDPASVNGYDETRYGADWKYELSSDVDFELEYYSARRDYDSFDALRNDRLFAKLSFEL